jgi:aspartyl protease family protein
VSGAPGDQALNFLYLVGVLVLVASALMVRRIPIGQGLKMAAGWVLIFLAIFVGFALKDDFMALGKRVLAEGRGEDQAVPAGRTLRIRKSPDGHFWVSARVNGQPVRFLIDSGATVTSLSDAAADQAGVTPSGGFPVLVQTANGMIKAERTEIDRLTVGTIERRAMPAQMSPAFGDTNVLGMDFLSSLRSWGVEGEWLVLTP